MKQPEKPKAYNTGNLKGISKDLYLLVKQYPGSTLGELASRYQGDKPRSRGELSKRMADLEHWGAVTKGDKRACTFSGRESHTWVAAKGVPARPVGLPAAPSRDDDSWIPEVDPKHGAPAPEVATAHFKTKEATVASKDEVRRLRAAVLEKNAELTLAREALEAARYTGDTYLRELTAARDAVVVERDAMKVACDAAKEALDVCVADKIDMANSFNQEITRLRTEIKSKDGQLEQSHYAFDAVKAERDRAITDTTAVKVHLDVARGEIERLKNNLGAVRREALGVNRRSAWTDRALGLLTGVGIASIAIYLLETVFR